MHTDTHSTRWLEDYTEALSSPPTPASCYIHPSNSSLSPCACVLPHTWRTNFCTIHSNTQNNSNMTMQLSACAFFILYAFFKLKYKTQSAAKRWEKRLRIIIHCYIHDETKSYLFCSVIPEYLSIHHRDVSLFWFSVHASSLMTADSMTYLCDTKDLTEQQFTLVQTNSNQLC